MNAKFQSYLILSLLVFGLALSASQPAAAGSEPPGKDETCIGCHENLYLLHDTGKFYCLCESQPRCTSCHGGVAGALDESTAHQGMVARPLQDGAAVCQSCHPVDYAERAASFAAIAGVRATQMPYEFFYPSSFAPQQPAEALTPQPYETWRLAGWALFAVAVLGLLVFAYRCWQCDCQSRRLSQ